VSRRFVLLDTPGAFNPARIRGLVRWHAANKIESTDGTAVGEWRDIKSDGDFAQATATKQPTWKANILGGKPALRFDVTDDQLLGGAGLRMSTFSVFLAVANITLGLSARHLVGEYMATGDQREWRVYKNAADEVHLAISSNGTTLGTSETGLGKVAGDGIYVATYDGATASLWKNGGTADTLSIASMHDGGVANLAIGDVEATGEPAGTDYLELAIYNRAVTDTERNRLQRYFARKYGFTLT
jgi:hypothetical protein